MRYSWKGLILLGLIGAAAPALASDDATVNFVQKAVVRALDFEEGDTDSFTDARYGFTETGWNDFLKTLGDKVNNNMPKVSSNFVPAGKPVVVSQKDGSTEFNLSGTLTQGHKNASKTTQILVQVRVDGTPAKIDSFKEKTCDKTPCQ